MHTKFEKCSVINDNNNIVNKIICLFQVLFLIARGT